MSDTDSKSSQGDPPTIEYASDLRRSKTKMPRRLIWVPLTVILLLAAIIALPMFNRPRILTNAARCRSNMKEIGLGAILYANDHGSRFPADLPTLFQSEDLAPAMFNCPSTNDTPASGPTTQTTLMDLKKPGHLSYIYVGKGLTIATATGDTVVLYEPLADHKNGINVLFGDGHVEWLASAQAQPLLKQAAAGVRPIRLSPSR